MPEHIKPETQLEGRTTRISYLSGYQDDTDARSICFTAYENE